MTKATRDLCSVFLVLALVAILPAHAQTYTDMFDFLDANGCCPSYPGLLAQGRDGNLYGTTQNGGTHALGTFFVVNPSTGLLSTLYNFDGTHGQYPQAGLAMGFDGNFYGTTYLGGASPSEGVLFKITPGGTLTVLHSFANTTDGAYPRQPPIPAPDGNLYGITGNGTNYIVYRVTPSGTFTPIATPPGYSYAPLLLASDGKLYGVTNYGGTYNGGTIFQLTLGKTPKLKIIYSFGGSAGTGMNPTGGLMQASDGKLYGTTPNGGNSSGGVVFQVTTGGVYKVLHSFAAAAPATDGYGSVAGLVQGSDGFLYGVNPNGGAGGFGTLFKINSTGKTFQVLHNFDGVTGAGPTSTPILHTNGKIYAMTTSGGAFHQGVVYSLDNALKPFASLFVTWSGKVGTSVGVLGQGFSNATAVKFGTGPGTFVAANDTYMTAAVAAGATTGHVTVLEPGGNLASPQTFKVVPTISGFSPSSGPVGTSVVITGMSLSQTTAVKFGGIKATAFTVNSDTQVTATVPTAAKTGKIAVPTKGGTATSAATFTVTP
ncbi:MAG TPA: choice-of-anchor tandem repeat GloVer-containing protein [Terriglobales bacterium]|nr:choice-of-anchor tandem repeat GloVer-containing protein [Terriglobales bacterium]